MSLLSLYQNSNSEKQWRNKIDLENFENKVEPVLKNDYCYELDENSPYFYHQMRSLLQIRFVLLHFLKVNGEQRLMMATSNHAMAKEVFPYLSDDTLNKVRGREDEARKNLAVIDVFIGEGRIFSTERLIHHAVYSGETDTASILRFMDEKLLAWGIEEKPVYIF